MQMPEKIAKTRKPSWSSKPAHFIDDALELALEGERKIVAIEAIGDIGGEEADLVAAIIGPAGEFEAGEFLPRQQADHRIGDLDLAARTRLLFLDLGEDLGLQDIAARDDEIGRCRFALRLLDR